MDGGPEDIFARRAKSPGRKQISARRAGLIGIAVALIVLVSAFRGLSIFYTDFLWFGSVDLTSVWSGLLLTKIGLALVAIALFFTVLYINLWIVDRFAPRALTFNQEDELARKYQEFVRPRATRLLVAVSLILAVIAGSSFSVHWDKWILFRNGGSFGVKDPQFNTDIGFFVFKLPFLVTLVNWTFYLLVMTLIVVAAAHYLQGAIRPQALHNRITSAVKTHVSILLGLLALVGAAHYWLQRYQLSYSKRGPVDGANYTDVNFLLPAFALLSAISIVAALVFFVEARRKGWMLAITTVVSWGLVSILIANVIPVGVQVLSVRPAESKKEAPFIQRNIEATRSALGLSDVQVNDFAYSPTLTAEQLLNNAPTIRNVRLWDPVNVQPVFQRLQENRSFFIFNDVDVDRYVVDNQTTQFELSVRELNISQLPSDRRSWVNEHLQYTHGYGAVAAPANAVSSNGDPEFSLKDLPPVGIPELKTPQVYFGERTPDYSIVNTDQSEVDFVSNTGSDQSSHYQGSGGVELSNLFRRLTFAARVGDINPLISGLVNSNSKAMYNTNIRQRVIKAAPFLSFDRDPYPVIADGRILWMQDAYTTSSRYPYASTADTSQVLSANGNGLKGENFNYIRNSVKITTDAYDGTMKFYVVDDSDPIVNAWRKAFPKLFVDGSEMPQSVRDHIRYPEDLFRVQSVMYGSYHMTNAADFYAKSDRWNIAQKPEFGDITTTTAAPVVNPAGVRVPVNTGENRIEPYYLLMRLPGETEENFLLFQPFVPYSAQDQRKELSAFMIAKSDPDEYGKLQTYVMPRDRQIRGPALVEAQIQQDPTIKTYVTLLNQSGSRVLLGNMLIIPIENSLLYVRPLYITAAQTQVPQFKKAIVVHHDTVKMEDTLQQALASIFGEAPETQEESRTPGADAIPGVTAPGAGTPTPGETTTSTTVPSTSGTPTSLPPERVNELLQQASDAFAAADAALRNGDLAGYQTNVKRGVDLVRQARGL